MKFLKSIVIELINSLPRSFKWSLFHQSFFNKRLRINFLKSRTGLFSKVSKIIVVGANDGLSFDDLFEAIHPQLTSGILLEPSSRYYKDLKNNTKNFPNLQVLQIAVNSKSSNLTLYQLNDLGLKKMPDWGRGLGSISKDHLLKYEGVLEEDIEFETVEGKEFNSIIKEYNLFSVDYLQIDTEGFDGKIIKMIDFELFSARLIKFEVANLSQEEVFEVKKVLESQGYFLVRTKGDMIAYSRNVNLFFF